MLNQQIRTILQQMPKAELHIHIEGSLEPELIFALAQRNGARPGTRRRGRGIGGRLREREVAAHGLDVRTWTVR